MGIRVQKVLGYGLTDVKTRKGRIADGRINANSRLLYWTEEPSVKVDEYLDWLKAKHEKIDDFRHFNIDLWARADNEGRRRLSMSNTVAYNPEYGMKNVLVLTPLSLTDWRRSDDPIDYIQDGVLRGWDNDLDHVEILRDGIFPFSALYMDIRTGERIKDEIMWWIRARNDRPNQEQSLELLARAAGFADHAEAEANVFPLIPNEIRDLAEFGKLFTNADVWKELRPLLYTYWG